MLLSLNITKLTSNIRGKSMPKQKFKSYLITNIPERDWKLFKRWTVLEGYDNLNHALSALIKLAGNNTIVGFNLGTENEQTT